MKLSLSHNQRTRVVLATVVLLQGFVYFLAHDLMVEQMRSQLGR